MKKPYLLAILVLACSLASRLAVWGEEPVPHGQDRPPGPALEPEEALRRMTVPPGFQVELVACEPDLVNPVAMTFDERGRIWVTESLEYPRREAGPGRDRVRILEDTDGDGRADKFTTFADGLNIPSGIAIGAGGVWVANAPDILFMVDEDGDDRADRSEVVVTGFGRDDTHELPNSLTWGPDGWLYGLNGVFNPSRVEQDGRVYEFTCALFRIHPRSRRFELFAEGTSNPWGVAFDRLGSAFVSACVIDHLWHLTETGYYHRQGGPYPPFTWKIESIVGHKHQKAAYCGIHYFDSDAYPPAYRERLYMGNIHGNCINCDVLVRNGSTYRGEPQLDFLHANDPWFMPVVQKTGPDGCLYILDWYDRYHCYQDANRDPQGIDRRRGRLYRVRYGNSPRAAKFDLRQASDAQLIEYLHSPNVYFRDTAQRLLWERDNPETRQKLQALVLADHAPFKARMHALWALVGCGRLEVDFHLRLLAHHDAALRAWAVRAAGNAGEIADAVDVHVVQCAADPSPDVRLQVAIAARKIRGLDAIAVLVEVLRHSEGDPLIPHIVWQNLHPLLERQGEEFLRAARAADPGRCGAVGALLPRVCDRLLARRPFDARLAVAPLAILLEAGPAADGLAGECLRLLAARVQSGEIADRDRSALEKELEPLLSGVLQGPADRVLYLDAALLATSLGDAAGLEAVRQLFATKGAGIDLRLAALESLIAARDPGVLDAAAAMLTRPEDYPPELRRQGLAALGRLDDPRVADVVLAAWPTLEPDVQPQAIELLTGRIPWAHRLLAAVGRGEIAPAALNLNQVRKLLATGDDELRRLVAEVWGTVRSERNPERERVIAQMRRFLRHASGDPHRGAAVFRRLCGQCHKIYGEGQEVGPDITTNGRSSFEQLLSNVFDPSLVIGAAYQARTVLTTDGRVLTGLLVEESDQRIVLKVQGGKLEAIARADVEEYAASQLSLMPEDLERQLAPQELADLFAFLLLDRPPGDPRARLLPGFKTPEPREAQDPAHFGTLVAEVAPGFTTASSGEGGVAILAEHFGRTGVLRTHPVSRDLPCVLSGRFDVPSGGTSRLVLDVSYDPKGDWLLVVAINGEQVHEQVVGPDTTTDGWASVLVDLSRYAGQTIDVALRNQANGWSWEYGYWGRVELVHSP